MYTQGQIIEKFKAIHGDKYDYSNVVYKHLVDNIEIICPKHGSFQQSSHAHLKGQGCPKCGIERRTEKRTYTTEDFIKKAREVHREKYTYDHTEYRSSTEKVTITCPIHGDVDVRADGFLSGRGCPKCGVSTRKRTDGLKYEEFIEKSRAVHGNKYDYSKVEYKNARTKVCIICPEHGEFWQTPKSHAVRGYGCKKCGRKICGEKLSKKTSDFIERARLIHNDKYDYSKVEYKTAYDKVCIICPEHGEFWQTAHDHLKGSGCPECGRISTTESRRQSKEEFVERARLRHGNRYDYAKTDLNNRDQGGKVIITCPEHGTFKMLPYVHLQGQGCPECGREKIKLGKDAFIEKAISMHGDKYDYSNVIYQHSKTPVEIICKKHGSFLQTPETHLKGCGCPKCGNVESIAEDEIYKFCCALIGEENVIHRSRTIISPKELDIYIPSKKIAIEYNGLRWHSEKFGKDRQYHLNKLKMCRERGIKLIQIFEDEYVNKKDVVLSKIQHLLGMSPVGALCKFYGRNCDVREIGKDAAKSFLEKNHIQGYVRSSIYLGAFYHDCLIAVMSFKKENDDKWELTRFASDIDLICSGVGGKLFKHFVRVFNPKEVKSFADRRWTIDENNLYTKLGFKFDKYTEPDYSYCKEGEIIRHHKFGFRKPFLNKKYGLPLSMAESEMTESLGYYKVWNCGLIKYVWRA